MPEQPSYFEKFTGLTGKTITELDQAKAEVEERGNQIQELAKQSSARFNDVMKMNQGLKEKIEFLQGITTMLSIRNEELEKRNQELEKQRIENNKLAVDLKENLEKVVLKEKDLELQKNQLERQIHEKTDELIKSQKLALIGELASRMAHDLRNPLSTIKNVVALIESRPKLRIEERMAYYGKLHRAIDRISHQVDDVLEYGRSTQLSLQTCQITHLISQTAAEGNFGSDVKINIENSEMKINVDVTKMEAVFTNLLYNAVQAMDGKGAISVRIFDSGANAIIAFEDSGPGIPQDMLSKVFDPLFTTKQTGTGLGLSICKKIIEQHGGSITVKNDPTTFIIRLPKNF